MNIKTEVIKFITIFSIILLISVTIAEPPKDRYGPPPPRILQKDYLPPNTASKPYSSAQLLPLYNAPEPFYGGPSPAEFIVTKNVYVHVPPEDPQIYQSAAPIQVPSVQKKHYKIIFIKAPSPPAPIRTVIPPPVQEEHKTLVYVLVKKPENPEPVYVPTPEPTEPSKPEVYFIKYRQEESKPKDQYGPPPETVTNHK